MNKIKLIIIMLSGIIYYYTCWNQGARFWIDRIEDFHKNLNGNVLFAFSKAHLYSN